MWWSGGYKHLAPQERKRITLLHLKVESPIITGPPERISPRSGRQHKAWGGAKRNPRIKVVKNN